MEYSILYASSPDKLSEKVAAALNSGWDLAGGVSAGMSSNNKMVLFQAVIK